MDTNIRAFGETAKSYYEIRMSELGVNDSNNFIEVNDPEADFPRIATYSKPIFSEDSDGNIQILYYTLDRELITYIQKGEGKTANINAKDRHYFQTRLKNPVGDKKYVLPKGQSTYPFLPLSIVEKWERKETIETLIITEGAFKAFIGAMLGLNIVGLPSITCYKNKETGRLHTDIERLIQDCKVKNLVILWDGDCLNISESDLDLTLELTHRPLNFINAAKAIQDLAKHVEVEDPLSIFFAHINSAMIPNNPKGLDDLLIECTEQKEAILTELEQLSEKQTHFFKFINITHSVSLLYNYFKLNEVHVFYNHHADKIAHKLFRFKGCLYQFSDTQGELTLVKSEWSNKIFWIGDEFFELVNKIDSKGIERQELIKREYTTLKRRFGRNFETKLHYYDGFCNVPSHFDYQQVVNNLYNLYSPFIHETQEGDYRQTLEFIKHIFGTKVIEYNGKEIPLYEIGLDYLQLLLMLPTQKLPVLILYSKFNNTGKSLFGKWQNHLFQANAVFVGNNVFESDFNEYWADKLLIICEETLLEKKAATEKIKAFSTADVVPVNPKGQKQYRIDFFGKFQFYSNNEKMIYLTKFDQRFWIVEVPTPKHDDPDLLQKMKDEVPAFLYFIKNRTLVTQRESRMHFKADLLKNDLFYKTVRLNEPSQAQELRGYVREIFLDFGQDEIYMTIKDINREFFKDKLSQTYLQKILQDYINVYNAKDEKGKSKLMRYEYAVHDTLLIENTTTIPKRMVSNVGRPYIFKRADFLSKDEDDRGDLPF